MKILQQKLQWTKSGTSFQNCQRGVRQEVKSKQGVINEARANNQKRSLRYTAGLLPLETRGIGRTLANISRQSDAARRRAKVDTGGCAVFTEQGASASHMTAATVLDTISRLPGMSGEANDAVSAFTQVKMSDASRLLMFHERNAQQCG